MERAVVIGSSPAALRAACTLASRGVSVRYLGTAANAAGVAPGPPIGLGAAPVRDAADEAALARVWGDLATFAAARAVAVGGRLAPLPLTRASLSRLLGPATAARAAAGVVRARARAQVGNVFDLAAEERSYAAWLEHRLGRTLSGALFLPYGRKRWGAEPDASTAWLAWATHVREAPARFAAPSAGFDATVAAQRRVVLDAGGEVLEGVTIEGFEVEGGRVTAVVTDVGREHVDSLVFVDATPLTVADWLPPEQLDDAARFDTGRLRAADAVEVTVRAEAGDLPWDVHIVDTDVPFWRLTRPGDLAGASAWRDAVTAHVTVPGDAPTGDRALVDAVLAGLRRFVEIRGGGEPIVRRLPGAVPLHGLTTAMHLGRRLELYDSLGIVGIGSRGAFRPADVTEEVALVERVLDTPPAPKRACNQREVHRSLFERPVRLPARASPWNAFAD